MRPRQARVERPRSPPERQGQGVVSGESEPQQREPAEGGFAGPGAGFLAQRLRRRLLRVPPEEARPEGQVVDAECFSSQPEARFGLTERP